MRRCARLLVAAAVLLAAAVSAPALAAAGTATQPMGPQAHGWWHPPARVTWYWQLQGRLRIRPQNVIDLDGFDTPASEVADLHRHQERVVCYVDVGTWEKWRPDAGRFPRALLGAPNGWPGERWLDIGRLSRLQPLMERRFEMCAHKGFDAVEGDNIDGYENHTGFALTAAQQLRYDRWFAHAVHKLGMAVLQKNDPEQARALEPSFDGVLTEQCNQYHECARFTPYLRAHKPVLDAEYRPSLYPDFCGADNRLGIMGALFGLSLNGARFEPCWSHG